MFRAIDGTIFSKIDTQNPATEVLFEDLSAQAAFDDENLLHSAFANIWFEPEDGTVALHPPTQYRVYLTPVLVNGRWGTRCGKIDFVDTSIDAPIAAPVAVPKVKPNSQPTARGPAPASPNPQTTVAATQA